MAESTATRDREHFLNAEKQETQERTTNPIKHWFSRFRNPRDPSPEQQYPISEEPSQTSNKRRASFLDRLRTRLEPPADIDLEPNPTFTTMYEILKDPTEAQMDIMNTTAASMKNILGPLATLSRHPNTTILKAQYVPNYESYRKVTKAIEKSSPQENQPLITILKDWRDKIFTSAIEPVANTFPTINNPKDIYEILHHFQPDEMVFIEKTAARVPTVQETRYYFPSHLPAGIFGSVYMSALRDYAFLTTKFRSADTTTKEQLLPYIKSTAKRLNTLQTPVLDALAKAELADTKPSAEEPTQTTTTEQTDVVDHPRALLPTDVSEFPTEETTQADSEPTHGKHRITNADIAPSPELQETIKTMVQERRKTRLRKTLYNARRKGTSLIGAATLAAAALVAPDTSPSSQERFDTPSATASPSPAQEPPRVHEAPIGASSGETGGAGVDALSPEQQALQDGLQEHATGEFDWAKTKKFFKTQNKVPDWTSPYGSSVTDVLTDMLKDLNAHNRGKPLTQDQLTLLQNTLQTNSYHEYNKNIKQELQEQLQQK